MLAREGETLESEGGFTLLEILMVLVIIAILAALVTPRLFGVGSRREIEVELRYLTLAVKLARSKAITEGRDHTLRVDPDAGRYWIQRLLAPAEGSSEEDATADETVGQEQVLMERQLPETLRFSDLVHSQTRWRPPEPPTEEPLWILTFRPDGTAEDVELRLDEVSGRSHRVRIYGLLGLAEVLEET